MVGDGGALAGIRVADFGTHLAGPLVGRILADLGATVVRVAPPGGPTFGSPALRHALARGKECREVDLKSAAGRTFVEQELAAYDVVVENFKPGVAAELGIDAASVRTKNAACVHLSLPGFAAGDERFDDVGTAWEAAILARCGVYSDMGLNRQLMGANPSYSPLPLASAYTSIIGALATCMALLKRVFSASARPRDPSARRKRKLPLLRPFLQSVKSIAQPESLFALLDPSSDGE